MMCKDCPNQLNGKCCHENIRPASPVGHILLNIDIFSIQWKNHGKQLGVNAHAREQKHARQRAAVLSAR